MDDKDFDNLIEGIRYAGAVLRGEIEPEPGSVITVNPDDIFPTVRFRHKYGLDHEQLASILGVDELDVVDWETDEAEPSAPVQLLLELLFAHPELVIETAKGLQGRIPANLTASP
jgi:DNA-binding transcriptional regulator YiaG